MGLWAGPGLVAVVGSAAFLSYRWPERLVARAAGVPARVERPEGAGREGGRAGTPPDAAAAPRASFDTLAARALAGAAGGWYSVQLRPSAPDARPEVTATVSTARALRPDRRATVTLDRRPARYASARATPTSTRGAAPAAGRASSTPARRSA
jgi:hypothetical protein